MFRVRQAQVTTLCQSVVFIRFIVVYNGVNEHLKEHSADFHTPVFCGFFFYFYSWNKESTGSHTSWKTWTVRETVDQYLTSNFLKIKPVYLRDSSYFFFCICAVALDEN